MSSPTLKKIRPPIAYHGGKYRLLNWILPELPKAGLLVDLFGGSGPVTLNTDFPKVIYNDKSKGLYSLFSQLKTNPKNLEWVLNYELKFVTRNKYKDFKYQGLVNSAPLDYEQILSHVFKTWLCYQPTHQLDLAARTFILYRLSLGGRGKNFSWSNRMRRGMPETLSKFYSSITLFPGISSRLARADIENLDWAECISRFDSADTTFYIDPPYVKSTRAAKNVYEYEFSDQDHANLAKALYNIKGNFVLSAYDSKLYWDLYGNMGGLRRLEKEVKAHSSGAAKKAKRKEILWIKH